MHIYIYREREIDTPYTIVICDAAMLIAARFAEMIQGREGPACIIAPTMFMYL